MSQANFPQFPENDKNPIPDLEPEDVALFVLASIAMEELGLSHILNAEGEKIQWGLGTLPYQTVTPQTPEGLKAILEINRSVLDTVEAVVAKNLILNMKAAKALRVLEYAQASAGYAAPAPAPSP